MSKRYTSVEVWIAMGLLWAIGFGTGWGAHKGMTLRHPAEIRWHWRGLNASVYDSIRQRTGDCIVMEGDGSDGYSVGPCNHAAIDIGKR